VIHQLCVALHIFHHLRVVFSKVGKMAIVASMKMNETISNRRPVYNKFKSSLIDGKLQVGLWLAFADAYVAEACATCGFDWLLIDGEHAPNDLRTMLMSLQAIAAYDANPVVRIPSGDETLIKQVLELGV